MTQSCWETDATSEGNVGTGSKIGGSFITGSGNPDGDTIPIGSSVTQATFYLRANSSSEPTAVISAAIYNSSGVLQMASTTARTFADLNTSTMTGLTFAFAGHTLADGDIVAVTNSAVSTSINLRPAQECSMSLTNPALIEYQSGSWNSPNRSCRIHMCLTYGGAPPGPSSGTRLPPPPIVLGGL